MIKRLLALGFWVLSSTANAHPLAPALLQWQATEAGYYEVLWRSSVLRQRGTDLWPEWPAGCNASPLTAAPEVDHETLQQRWQVQCVGPLQGRVLTVHGLQDAGISVVLRVQLGKGRHQTLLDARQPSWQVPESDAPASVFGRYLWLGVDHLWRGIDHVLFVIGLMLLVNGLRRLIVTITAFTLGHSLTLGLSVLDIIRVSEDLAEWGIALSLLLLALTVVRRGAMSTAWLARYPALMAASFGLIHGLGFAGALREVGLPVGEIPLALLAFNIGIELGQIALVVALLSLARVWRSLAAPDFSRAVTPTALAYPIGILSVYWLFSRSVTFWGIA